MQTRKPVFHGRILPSLFTTLGLALLGLTACVSPVDTESTDALDDADGPTAEAAQGITVSGMGHYCSKTQSNGTFNVNWDSSGNDPCALISGGTIQRAGLYSVSDVNNAMAQCDGGFRSTSTGTGSNPIWAVYIAALNHTNCVITVSPKTMPIFDAPFTNVSVSPGTGFDFAKPPYNALDVQDFGQSGSSSATIVDFKGRDKMNQGFIDNHDAHDWGMPRGTPLRAPAAGVIRKARFFNTGCQGSDSPNQGEVYIDHFIVRSPSTYNERFTSAFFHMQELAVSDGQGVQAGQIIGYSGNTGCSSGPHLHFAVMRMSNTSFARIPSLTIDANGNDGWRMVIEPYGWDPPTGFDPWATGGIPLNAGALSVNLWRAGQAPSIGTW